MNCLRIILFGKFSVVSESENRVVIEPAKVQELFFYLLLHADRPHTREKLAELLWPDSTAVQSRKYLRQTLWQLQSILDETLSKHKLLTIDSDWIQVDPKADYWLDTQAFQLACVRSQGVTGATLSADDAQALKEAVVLYKGDLLENFYQDWCLFERERLQNIYLTILHKLMVFCECTQQFEAGIMYGMKILECDQAREQTHRQLMRLHFLAGDRTGALRQYDRCMAVLRQELDVDPAQRTCDLVQQIRQGKLKEIRTHTHQATPPQTAVSPTPDLLNHLNHLKESLIHTQRQVDHNISLLQNQDHHGTQADQP